MAIVGPLGLVKLIREVSVAEVRKQANRVPKVVLCGTPEERDCLRALLRAGSEDELDRSRLAQAVVEIDLPLEGDEVVNALAAQMVLTAVPPDRSLLRLKVPIFQVTDAESLRQAGLRIAHQDDAWIVPLGRHVPGLRAAMTERLTAATATANAEIALISALPGIVPITSLLLPPASVADIVLLTKNQMMMVLKIAATYGKPVEITTRLWELAPVVGGAFGWRALAREIVGMVPGGVGVAARASVAFAGTITVGRAAQLYYERGHHISAAEQKRIFAEAMERAREVVNSRLQRLRRKPRAEEEEKSEADAPGG